MHRCLKASLFNSIFLEAAPLCQHLFTSPSFYYESKHMGKMERPFAKLTVVLPIKHWRKKWKWASLLHCFMSLWSFVKALQSLPFLLVRKEVSTARIYHLPTLSSLEIFSLKVPVRISAYCSKSYLKKERFWQKVKLSCYVHHVLLQFLTRTLFHERILLWFHFFDSGRSKSGQQQKGLNYCKKNVMRFMIFFCY